VKLLQLLVAARQRYSTIHTTRDSKHTVSSTPLYKISVSQGSGWHWLEISIHVACHTCIYPRCI